MPLYSRLCAEVSEDEELLWLTVDACPGQPVTYLLFGAVHDLILRGTSHPISAVYDGSTRGQPLIANAYTVFRDFCLSHRTQVQEITSSRLVQTNEIGRSALVALGLAYVASVEHGEISLVDIGASAGLNLSWDSYSLQFHSPGESPLVWNSQSHVKITCTIPRHARSIARKLQRVRIAERLGIELRPLDLRDPEAVRWLYALVWPNQVDRKSRLQSAIHLQLLSQELPILRSDATTELATVIERLRDDTTLCLFESHIVEQLSRCCWESYERQFARIAKRRDIFRITISSCGDKALMMLRRYRRKPRVEEQILAVCHPHGLWADWVIR
jgi:hypothetical protein